MPIPDYQTVMLPLLKLVASQGPIKLRDARRLVSDSFNLTQDERNALLPSGKQPIIYNRVGWASTYLRKSMLIAMPQRGVMEITDRGRKVLAENPTSIDVKFLERFAEFQEFRKLGKDESEISVATELDKGDGTPEEVLEDAHLQLKNQILADIVDKMKSCSFQFFEGLVVDTIVKMGYGGSRKDAGRVVGESGDGGVDGIINEDRLGLDVIYLQAKRWEGNVGRPEIQKFAGALQGKRAKKGIFITSSDFTLEAREFVRNLDSRIILISGHQLAELMWEHGVGLSSSAIYEVKKIDLDYFSE